MLIDFKEIQSAKGGNPNPDTFEMFAREYLAAIGFEIKEGPDRGADGGRDIIVVEKRKGIIGTTDFTWLVSCKHFAHSGKAVGENDEENIVDRVNSFHCDGFIGFYSTIPSSMLQNRLNGLPFPYKLFDKELIERHLLENKAAYELIKRFFPESWKKINSTAFEFSNLLKKYYPLNCDVCGKDLLQSPQDGLLAYVTDRDDCFSVKAVYCACKGECDERLEKYYDPIGLTSWWDLSTLSIPRQYLSMVLGLADNHEGSNYKLSDEAYKKARAIYIRLAQLVMRKHTDEEETQLSLMESI